MCKKIISAVIAITTILTVFSGCNKNNTSVAGENRTSFNDYSLILPEDWVYEVSDNEVIFYEKYNYENENTGSKGYLFSIVKTEMNPEDYSESAILLGTQDEYNYIRLYPMGFGIIEDEEAREKWSSAMGEVDPVLETFQLIQSTISTETSTEPTTMSNKKNVEISEDYKLINFNMTFDNFQDKYNSMYAESDENKELLYTELDYPWKGISPQNIQMYLEPGLDSYFKELTSDFSLGFIVDNRVKGDKKIKEIIITADADNVDINNIEELYTTVLKILLPDYSNSEVSKIVSKIFSKGENVTDSNYNIKFIDNNVKYMRQYYSEINAIAFMILASADEETAEKISDFQPVAANNSEINEAENLLIKKDFGSQFGTTNVLNAIYYYLDNVTLEATKDFYGNITLKYIGYFHGVSSYITYETDIEYGYAEFIESSLDWSYMEKTYGTGNL